MDADRPAIRDEVAALKEALAIEQAKALEIAVARAKASEDSALIAQQKLRIAKLERQIYGPRSERSSRLIEQLALAFEELQPTRRRTSLRPSALSPRRRPCAGLRAGVPSRGVGLVSDAEPCASRPARHRAGADALARLRAAESFGRPLGDGGFLAWIERATGRRLAPEKRGPKPWMDADANGDAQLDLLR